MGERLCLIAEQAHDVAGQPARGAADGTGLPLDRLRLLAALQAAAGPPPAHPPFPRGNMLSRDLDIRGPPRRSISAWSRGSVQFVRFATGADNSSRASASAASP